MNGVTFATLTFAIIAALVALRKVIDSRNININSELQLNENYNSADKTSFKEGDKSNIYEQNRRKLFEACACGIVVGIEQLQEKGIYMKRADKEMVILIIAGFKHTIQNLVTDRLRAKIFVSELDASMNEGNSRFGITSDFKRRRELEYEELFEHEGKDRKFAFTLSMYFQLACLSDGESALDKLLNPAQVPGFDFNIELLSKYSLVIAGLFGYIRMSVEEICLSIKHD